jgi:predicted nucleotidyltransferase
MKTDLNYLPTDKQAELFHIVSLIKETVPAEMIILFGSCARNDWVEEKYDEDHFKYQSDMDILVIVENKSETTQSKFERDIEYKIEQDNRIKTPVSVIVHDVDFINRRLSKAQYFFTDIKKEGVLLYDSAKHRLSEAKELLSAERKKLAEDDLNYYFEKAEKFIKLFKFALSEHDYNEAAFLLHQITERLYYRNFTRVYPLQTQHT